MKMERPKGGLEMAAYLVEMAKDGFYRGAK